MPVHGLAWIFALGALVVAGCAHAQAPVPGTPSEASPHVTIQSDLLERPDLQRLVDAQVKRDTAKIVEDLSSEDAVIRSRAALALGSLRSAGSTNALVLALTDSIPEVRAHAAFALGQGGSLEAIAPLIDALRRDTDHSALAQIAHALGRVGDRSALAALAASEVPAGVEADRAVAIARFGMRDVHDPSAVALILELLRSRSAEVRAAAAYYFSRATVDVMWTQHAGDLRSVAEDLVPGDEALSYLATGLGRLGESADDAWLIGVLEGDPDWRNRVSAARALAGADRSTAVIDALLRALHGDDSFHVSGTAAVTLGSREDLTPEHLDRIEDFVAAHPHRWQEWHGAVPSLARGERQDQVLAAIDAVGSPLATAAIVRGWSADSTQSVFSWLLDYAGHEDPHIAAAAIDALRSHPLRTANDAATERYYTVLTRAIERLDGATVFAAAPALADSGFHAMGAGVVMRDAYARLSHRRSIGPMAAIISAHGSARDSTALDFLIGAAIDAPHPVLREAAIGALNDRFIEGIQFSSVGGSPPTFPAIDWSRLQDLGPRPRLVLETNRGEITLDLFTDWAPATVSAITRFAEEGRYDGVLFHRVVSNFVIQGGDFGARDGFGGPDFFVPSEFTPLPYRTGTLGMASSGPDTEGSQFFVMHSPHPHLDGRYTVFGEVVTGQDVVDQIRVDDRVLRTRVEPGR